MSLPKPAELVLHSQNAWWASFLKDALYKFVLSITITKVFWSMYFLTFRAARGSTDPLVSSAYRVPNLHWEVAPNNNMFLVSLDPGIWRENKVRTSTCCKYTTNICSGIGFGFSDSWKHLELYRTQTYSVTGVRSLNSFVDLFDLQRRLAQRNDLDLDLVLMHHRLLICA